MTDLAIKPSVLVEPGDLVRPPRYATKRNPLLRTRGAKIAILAAAMGKPLMPHQRYIVDVATELNPPGSRLKYRYQTIVISLPRQTGKTTMQRPIFIDRALSKADQQIFMTAQMGKDSTARWNDLIEDLEESKAFGHYARVLRSKGSERCQFPNGSFISPFAPGKKSLHGYSPPLVSIDEGWAFDKDTGADLLKAIRPAQITKTDRQLIIMSAAGEQDSVWWNELVAAGRDATLDPDSKTAYFEWSADPDLDPMDPETWAFHPGLDGLITIDDLLEEAKPENNSHGDFLRGYMNRSTDQVDNAVLDLEKWIQTTRSYDEPRAMSTIHLSFDVAIDRTAASVYGAWLDSDNLKHVVLVETREGADWLTPYLSELLEKTPPASLSADDGGATRLAIDELERLGHQVHTLDGSESSTAWIAFKAAANAQAPAMFHDNNQAIVQAIKVAVEARRGDTVVLSQTRSLGPIDSLRAAYVAAWQVDRMAPNLQVW